MSSVDSLNMRKHVLAMADQAQRALDDARGLEGLPEKGRIEHIVVIATGDDLAAGDALAAVAAPFTPLPISVLHDYELPSYVGDGSLVFSMSAEGDTEEIVDVTTSAVTQGAHVVVIGGGQLAKEAVGWGAPIIDTPPGTPTGRAAIAFSAVAPIIVLEDLGIFPGASEWAEEAITQLRKRAAQLKESNNVAQQLAEGIGVSLPVFYGGGALGAAAAHRCKVSVNLNAQVPAFWNSYPEAAHSELSGWTHPRQNEMSETAKRRLYVVNLRHDSEHPQIADQFAQAAARVSNAVVGVEDVQAEGEGELAQLLDLIMVGDTVSLYIAEAMGIDPGPLTVQK